MIAKISGKLLQKFPSSIIIQAGGIGFEVLISAKTFEKLPDVNNDIELDAYLHVREDDLKLVGFSSLREKELFLKLLGVSGVSIKIALSAFSLYNADELKKTIINGEVELIRRIPGIGKKLAERIILELREKLADEETIFGIPGYFWEDKKIQEVKQALRILGYSLREINKAFSKIESKDIKDMRTEDIIKLVLREV